MVWQIELIHIVVGYTLPRTDWIMLIANNNKKPILEMQYEAKTFNPSAIVGVTIDIDYSLVRNLCIQMSDNDQFK